ncbi:hypothetical protein MATL_G00217050 [Megalops atlanticus]|uniref:Uncharacterized protein n=1 Tax=Megalops atlanticus TaxID=7932 RepID=A0A9D3SY14_MEGAT|nr:hypothetical protein MATL_G00217050 [Megalops atlanticus]
MDTQAGEAKSPDEETLSNPDPRKRRSIREPPHMSSKTQEDFKDTQRQGQEIKIEEIAWDPVFRKRTVTMDPSQNLKNRFMRNKKEIKDCHRSQLSRRNSVGL